jgi:hypothetical protein
MRHKTLVSFSLLLILFALDARAQQTPTPAFNMQPLYDWMPDCSNEGTPLPAHIVNLHRYAQDNRATPHMTPAPADTRRGAAGYMDKCMDVVVHTYGGVQYKAIVREVRRDRIAYHTNTRAVKVAGGASAIYITKINMGTGGIVYEGVISDSACTSASLPKIHVGLNGAYNITYKRTDANGDQVWAVRIAAGSPLNITDAISLSGTNYYNNLAEYSVDPDDSYGFAVVARNVDATTGFSSILGQQVDLWWGLNWNATDFKVINTGANGIGNNNTGSHKWNPIVMWNTHRSRYEIFWGDDKQNPSTAMCQSLTAGGAIDYTLGGVFVWNVVLDPYCEFYGAICADYNGPITPLSFLLYRDNNGGIQLKGLLHFGSPPGALVVVTNLGSGYPAALMEYDDGTDVDALGLYVTNTGTLRAVKGDVSGIAPNNYDWRTNAGIAPVSTSYESYLGSNSYGIWAVIPDDGRELTYRIDPTTGAFSTTNRTVDTRSYEVGNGGGTKDASYFACANDATDLVIAQYEYGYLLEALETRCTEQDPETDEDSRESHWNNEFYTMREYDCSASPVFSTVSVGELKTFEKHMGARTAVRGDKHVTVYERWRSDGLVDIVMGYNNGSGLNIPVVIATGNVDTAFIRPQVAITYDPGIADYVATITYVGEHSTGSVYMHQTRELSTGTLPYSGPAALTSNVNQGYYRNWAAVTDTLNAYTSFILGFGYNPFGAPGLMIAGFDETGTPHGWGSNPMIFRSSSGSPKDQVRAVFNPDAGFSGQYVTWREDGALGSIDLLAINSSTGGNWPAGLLTHAAATGTNKGEPVVTCNDTTVFIAWRDQQVGAGQNRIYGCAYTNGGTLRTGWNTNGVILTKDHMTPTWTIYQAEQPDVVMLPGYFTDRVALAYTERGATELNYNMPKRIRVRTIDITTLVQKDSTALTFPGQTYQGGTSTDEIEAMHGFFQRRPKLALGWSKSPYFPPNQPQLMCAFETQAFNLANGAYSAIEAIEDARFNAGEAQYSENNIASIVLTTGLSQLAKFSVARKAGAQDLDGLYFTNEQGYIAGYTDYLGSDSYAGIAKTVNVNMEVRDYADFSATGYNITWWPSPASSFPVLTHSFRLFNNSLIDLKISMEASSTSPLSPSPYVTWDIDPDVTLSQYSSANVDLTYQPNASSYSGHQDDVTIDLYPHMYYGTTYTPPTLATYTITGATGTGVFKPVELGSEVLSTKLNVSVSPNPAMNTTTLRMTGAADHNVVIRLYNVVGQEVLAEHSQFSSNGNLEHQLNIMGVPSGAYTVEVIEDTGRATNGKLIIQ